MLSRFRNKGSLAKVFSDGERAKTALVVLTVVGTAILAVICLYAETYLR